MVRKEVKASSSDANKLKKNKRTSVAVMVFDASFSFGSLFVYHDAGKL